MARINLWQNLWRDLRQKAVRNKRDFWQKNIYSDEQIDKCKIEVFCQKSRCDSQKIAFIKTKTQFVMGGI